MQQRLTLGTAFLLTVPPLMWAGNSVVGRLVRDMISPMTLNFIRWVLAFVLLAPLALWVLRGNSPLWAHWKRFAVLGLLGIGSYNALLYLALQTSTPLNVTLVGSSLPLCMLAIGTLCFGARVTPRELVGAVLSVLGVLLVLSRGRWNVLVALQLVPGDLYTLLATLSWAFYSWALARTQEPVILKRDWSSFLMAQLVFGLAWSGSFAAGEWALTDAHIDWSWALAAALAFIAVGPAILAYRCWGLGVQRAGPQMAAFFINLTPIFAAMLSVAFLREVPHWYHAVAFALIVAGIVVSSRKTAESPPRKIEAS